MGDKQVDPAFLPEVDDRPKPKKIEVDGIPLIDLSVLNSPHHTDADLAGLASEIGDASQKWGFFQVINHGVPLECREKLESAARKFFALPKEEKSKSRRVQGNTLGWTEVEQRKNVRDWKEVFDMDVVNPAIGSVSNELDDQQLRELNLILERWPQNPPEFREACEEYAYEMEKLAFKLLELIAVSLGLPKHKFNGLFEAQTTLMRLNCYPPCPKPDLALGCGPHTDAGAITILGQDDVGRLEIWNKTVGEWIHVKPTPSAYVINIADLLQVWSNDKYESAQHRVRVNCEKTRFSIPFFFHPALQTWVEPLEELINEQNPRKYKGFNWGKFFEARKLGIENGQIFHFKVDK